MQAEVWLIGVIVHQQSSPHLSAQLLHRKLLEGNKQKAKTFLFRFQSIWHCV